MAGGPRLGGHGGGIGLDARELPLSAIAFVDANGLRDRMYNDFEIGSYLLFEPAGGYPHHRVFVDPRLPAYPARVPPPARPFRPDPRRVERRDGRLRRRDRAARHTRASTRASPGGIRNATRSCSAKRTRASSSAGCRASRALIARDEIPATFAFSPQEGTATLPLEKRPAASPVPECEWQRRLGRSHVRPRRDAVDAHAGGLRPRAGGAGGLPAARRRGAPRRLAGRDRAGGGPRRGRACRCSIARSRTATRELTTLANRAVALEALGRNARRGGGVGPR